MDESGVPAPPSRACGKLDAKVGPTCASPSSQAMHSSERVQLKVGAGAKSSLVLHAVAYRASYAPRTGNAVGYSILFRAGLIMAKLAPDSKREVKDTVCQADQLNPGLARHAVTHRRQIEPGAAPSNADTGQTAHPLAPPSLIRGID